MNTISRHYTRYKPIQTWRHTRTRFLWCNESSVMNLWCKCCMKANDNVNKLTHAGGIWLCRSWCRPEHWTKPPVRPAACVSLWLGLWRQNRDTCSYRSQQAKKLMKHLLHLVQHKAAQRTFRAEQVEFNTYFILWALHVQNREQQCAFSGATRRYFVH